MATQAELYQYIIQAGGTPDEARKLAAVAMDESGGRSVKSSVDPNSWGPWQINLDAWDYPRDAVMNPATAAQAALQISRTQRGLKHWSVYLNNPDKYENAPAPQGVAPMPENGNPNYEPWNVGEGGDPTGQSQPQGSVGTGDPSLTVGPNGELLKYDPVTKKYLGFYQRNPNGRDWDWYPAEDGQSPDSPAQTRSADASYKNAEAAAKNADTSRLNAIVNAIDMKIKAEGIPAEQAMNIFKAEIQKLTLQQNQDISQGDFSLRADDQNLRRTTAMNTDAREREIQEQQRKVDLQRVATDRGISAARDILPSAIPGATSINLMGMEMPLPQVNLDQFYSQGLPPLIDQWNNPIASSAPNPWGEPTTAPQLTPLELPTVPEPAPPVDIDAIFKMVRGWM